MKEKNKLFTDFLADTTNPIVLITLTLGNKSFLEKASFSVEITQKTNDHDEFLIIVPDIAVDAFSGYILENSKHLLGENLIINFHRYGVVNQSFTGVITRILNKKNQGGGYGELHILGKSLSILLENGKNCQSFENQSLSEIVESVSQGKITPVGGLNFESKIPYVVQWQESDYAFFSRLAKRYGEFFYYNENELIFGNKTQNTVILEEGGELLEVSFELFVKPQKFNYLSYDLGKGGRIEKEDSSISVQEKNNSILQVAKNISERIFTKKSETYASQVVDYQEDYFLSELVKKEKESREQLLKIRGKSLNPLLKNGGFIKLKDINGKPMETYRIIEIKHYQSGYEYFNEFIAIPDVFVPYYFDADAFPKSEAQIAKVLDNNDPEGLGRVRVQFLWQEKNQQKTPWIRVLQPHTGAGKGFYFVPEIGEEVWVDFENQNAERPYVVGSQYNGKQKSLYHTTGNDKKVIHTRSGTKIILNDAQGSIFIEDASGNTFLMDGQGNINLNAPKNITFTAGENFTLNVGQNMTTNIGNNLTNNILGNEITKIEGGVKQDILGDFLFSATNVQQEIKGDKSEDILGKLVQSTAETYAQATQGDMIFQSNNISKFLGKTDVKVNKTSGEMMAVPKVSQIKNKERNEKTPEILEFYFTDLQGNKIKESDFEPNTIIYLNIKGKNLNGEKVDFDLQNAKVDFECKSEYLKNDILKDYTFKSDNEKIELKVIKPKNE